MFQRSGVHLSDVRGIDQNAGNQEFLKGLCNVAHAIGIAVIAVGVQNETELAKLRELGFDRDGTGGQELEMSCLHCAQRTVHRPASPPLVKLQGT